MLFEEILKPKYNALGTKDAVPVIDLLNDLQEEEMDMKKRQIVSTYMYIERNKNEYKAAQAGYTEAFDDVATAKEYKGDMDDAMERAEYTHEVNKAQVELNIYSEMKLQIEVNSDFVAKYIFNDEIRNLVTSMTQLNNVVLNRKTNRRQVKDLTLLKQQVENSLSLVQNKYF